MTRDGAEPVLVHGTAVALEGRGLLIQGKSGSGKTMLALDMISRGATLIADDRVVLIPRDTGLMATAPERIAGLIEARGVGLLCLPHTTAPLVAVADMDSVETERLPHAHDTVIAGTTLPVLRKVESPAFAAMLHAYLKGGRKEP